MLDDAALAVSLPVVELRGLRLPGSVFLEAHLAGARFSAPLARALEVLRASAAYAGVKLAYVARPEILAHGEGLAWLRARLGPVRRHLALSDGATIKSIPGMENYVFFFGLSRSADAEALSKLRRRAPEAFAALAGQVNTALRLGSTSIVIEGAIAPSAPVIYYPAALDPGSLEDGLARTLRAGQRSRLPLGFSELVYAPLTEASLDDARFLRWLAAEAGRRYFGQPRAMVIGLPENAGASVEIVDRLRIALAGLRDGGARMPLAPADGVWFAAGDPTVGELLQSAPHVDLAAPASFDFWRAPPAGYRGFRSLVVHAEEQSDLHENFEGVIEALTSITPRFASSEAPFRALYPP